MPFIPHTPDDVEVMLAATGVSSITELFDEIPAALRIDGLASVGPALSEAEISRVMQRRARADGEQLCFIGAGAYDHYVPAAVWDIATRGEFYSAYTPYQAEASQGTLQVIYEFQSMLAGLTGLDVSNASLYDGATAFAEACLMAVRANRGNRSRRILVPRNLAPAYRAVARNLCQGQQLELVELPICDGRIDQAELDALAAEGFSALAIQQPSFLGTLEDVDVLTDWAHTQGALVIAVVNPLALAVLRPPGQWGNDGADIACGEGQPLGVPLSAGGPYIGFLVCRQAIVRQMPGRIAGRTLDIDGKPGFTLTLQAREQHIRRSRATSNICTNQGLVATAVTIYMALMGADGLRRVALSSNANTLSLVRVLCELPGVTRAFETPFFHEAVLCFEQPVAPLLAHLSQQGIVGGYDLGADYPELGSALLVCATETRDNDDIQAYAGALAAALQVKA